MSDPLDAMKRWRWWVALPLGLATIPVSLLVVAGEYAEPLNNWLWSKHNSFAFKRTLRRPEAPDA